MLGISSHPKNGFACTCHIHASSLKNTVIRAHILRVWRWRYGVGGRKTLALHLGDVLELSKAKQVALRNEESRLRRKCTDFLEIFIFK